MNYSKENCDLFTEKPMDHIGQNCNCKVNECKYLQEQHELNKRPRCYISGKITGLEESEAYALFEKAEKEVWDLGYIAVNPMKLEHDHDQSWESYMKEDIKALCDCKAIFLLTNWSDSKGACIEWYFARTFRLIIHFQPTES